MAQIRSSQGRGTQVPLPLSELGSAQRAAAAAMAVEAAISRQAVSQHSASAGKQRDIECMGVSPEWGGG